MIGSGSTTSTEYILKFESISKGEAGVVQSIDVDVRVASITMLCVAYCSNTINIHVLFSCWFGETRGEGSKQIDDGSPFESAPVAKWRKPGLRTPDKTTRATTTPNNHGT